MEVSKERSIVYHPEYKGIRLDVYAKDEKNTHYNVEMQAAPKQLLGKRARYYHSQIDMELLATGQKYEKLSNSYVIFICDFDPFGKRKYCYTFANQCLEDVSLNQADGSISIFLSTRGENENEVSERLVKFLNYVKANKEESEKDFEDEFISKLQKSVQNIKKNRAMEERFMLFELMLKEERVAGKTEVIISLLEDLGEIPNELRELIMSQVDSEIVMKWIKVATKAKSVEEFQRSISSEG